MEKDAYQTGVNKELDLKFSQYKSVNLFTGRAYHAALSEDEARTLIKLWKKERKCPWTLKMHEVTKLVEFYEKILAWRRSDKREKARLRVKRARKKLKEAARNGDANAVR